MDNTGKIYLGNLGRVPLYASFEAIFLVVFVFYQWQGMPRAYQSGAYFICLILIFLLTIVLHELAHALAALSRGMSGVTITIGALGGYCSYVGVPQPARQFMISCAGPLTNLLIAYGFYLLARADFSSDLLRFFVEQMFFWNLVLGILNLLPIYPLDGGQMLLALSELGLAKRSARHLTLCVSLLVGVGLIIYALSPFNHYVGTLTIVLIISLLFAAFRDLRS